MFVAGYKKGKKFDLEVTSIGLGLYLAVEAAKAFNDMKEAARKDGIELVVNTAFRDNDYQSRLRQRYEAQLVRWEACGRKGPKPAPAAKAGYSNHQSGISVDINRAPGDDPKTKIPDSPVDRWLYNFAAQYGFVFDVNGELWHLTYLPDIAIEVVEGSRPVYWAFPDLKDLELSGKL